MGKKLNFASAPMNMAHTYGNVCAYVTETIQSWFPPDFFKTVNISSTIAYRYFNVLQNKNQEVFRKEKPYLIIRPRIVHDAEDSFLHGTFMTNHISEAYTMSDAGNLLTLVDDQEGGFQIKFLMNRPKIYFDVTMIVETQMSQLNLQAYLRNRVVVGRPLRWNTCLESHIPREMIAAACYVKNMQLTEPAKVLNYLNGNSLYPITYKMKNSSGNDEYFMYYDSNIEVLISQIEIDDGSKRGHVDDSYTVSFTVETEFVTAGIYNVFTREPMMDPHFFLLDDESHITTSVNADKNSIELHLTSLRNLGLETPTGWDLYGVPAFNVGVSSVPDILDFKPVLNNSLLRVIEYHKEKQIPFAPFIKIAVLKDNKLLNPDEGEYVLDLVNYRILTYKLSKFSTYRMVIMINVNYINELTKFLLDRETK